MCRLRNIPVRQIVCENFGAIHIFGDSSYIFIFEKNRTFGGLLVVLTVTAAAFDRQTAIDKATTATIAVHDDDCCFWDDFMMVTCARLHLVAMMNLKWLLSREWQSLFIKRGSLNWVHSPEYTNGMG